MWKSFEIDGKYFILHIKSEENSLEVSISDLHSIWRENMSSTDILIRFKEMNPSFECDENIKESVFSMIDNIDRALEKHTEWKEDTMLLDIKSELGKYYNIRFRFVLKKLINGEFFSEVTLAMARTVSHLERQQDALQVLLKKKDRELQEYKLEKGEISREDLKTQPYDCDTIRCSSDGCLMLNLFDKGFFPETTDQDSCSEDNSNKSLAKQLLEKTKPLKRRIYSGKNSNKRPNKI